MPDDAPPKAPSRIQLRNRRRILDAALDVFAVHGYRGATLDQIAAAAGLSQPNLLYYFAGKEELHVTLLDQLDPSGDPLEEILAYVQRKLDMARDLPRESRLFANEILQGAPRMAPHLEADLKPLFDEKCGIIQSWIDAGKLAPIDPRHLIFANWAATQHYADFGAQIRVLLDTDAPAPGADPFLQTLFTNLLKPAGR